MKIYERREKVCPFRNIGLKIDCCHSLESNNAEQSEFAPVIKFCFALVVWNNLCTRCGVLYNLCGWLGD